MSLIVWGFRIRNLSFQEVMKIIVHDCAEIVSDEIQYRRFFLIQRYKIMRLQWSE